MNSNKNMFIKFLMLLGVGFILASCTPGEKGGGAQQGPPAPPPPGVNVTKIENIEVVEKEEYIGKIYARDVVDIVARVEGYLEKHYFNEGAIVNKGSLLFLIEQDQYQAEVEQARADIENIKATLANDEKNLVRVEELVKDDYISHSNYDAALSQRDQSVASLKAKEAALKKAELNLKYTKIYAPIMGKIGNLKVTEGNLVGPLAGSLATIVKLNPIYVTYKVPAEDFTRLRKKLSKQGKSLSNKKIELFLSDGKVYPLKGVIDFYDNKVDESTNTIEMRAKFPNPDGILLPGQLCSVVIYEGKSIQKPAIIQSAVLEDTAGKYVYTLDKENAVQRQGIKVGQQVDEYWVIKDGLNLSDTVVTTGLQKIRHGMKVNVMKDPQKSSEGKGSK